MELIRFAFNALGVSIYSRKPTEVTEDPSAFGKSLE